MAKRISQEEVVVTFFNTADLAKVETVFNIIKSIVKTRTAGTAKAVKPVKVKAPKATDAAAAPPEKAAA
jgi:hypothetical protein